MTTGNSKSKDLNSQEWAEWQEWDKKKTVLEPGTYVIEVVDIGPMELYPVNFSDKDAFVVTSQGWVLRLSESMFRPFVSRYDIREGFKARIFVAQKGSTIQSAEALFVPR